MIVGEIIQTGMLLETENNVLPPQWSENLQIQVSYDDTFVGWSVKWDAINDISKKRIPVAYDPKTKCITLNKECFHGNYLYLACVFIKEKECHNTDPVEFYIPNSLKHGLNNDPNIPNLYDEMRELFQQIIDNEYREPMDDLIDRCDNAIVEVRITNEGIKTNEQERVVAESNRQAQERVRVNEEKGRQTNETVRNSSESNRLSNENARKEAESNRVTAENARVTAETKRQTDTSDAIERATTAAERCEEFVEELDGKVNVSDIDATLSATSTNPIQNKAVYEALQNIDVSGGGGDTLPIGIIVPYASDTVPDGWLLCDGSSIMRRDYPELFDVIGESYGAGDGVTTFALPNEPNPLAYTKSNNAIQFLERSPELYMIIKAKQSTPLEGNVVNSLESNSETDAPSIKAVNDALSGNFRSLSSNMSLFAWDSSTKTKYYVGTYTNRYGWIEQIGSRVFIDVYITPSSLGNLSNASGTSYLFIDIPDLPDYDTLTVSPIGFYNVDLLDAYTNVGLSMTRMDGKAILQLVQFGKDSYAGLTVRQIKSGSTFNGSINYRKVG